jgi:hypothetical protein
MYEHRKIKPVAIIVRRGSGEGGRSTLEVNLTKIYYSKDIYKCHNMFSTYNNYIEYKYTPQ